jgi:hypothetical protein
MPVAAIPTSTQHRLPPYLHQLKTVAAIPTSTQCRLPPYLHLLNADCRHTYIYSKERRECFLIHEIKRINGGRGFQTGGKVLQIGGNTFYDQKNKILMKILEFKRSGIRIIEEFRGIPSGFPSQDQMQTLRSIGTQERDMLETRGK